MSSVLISQWISQLRNYIFNISTVPDSRAIQVKFTMEKYFILSFYIKLFLLLLSFTNSSFIEGTFCKGHKNSSWDITVKLDKGTHGKVIDKVIIEWTDPRFSSQIDKNETELKSIKNLLDEYDLEKSKLQILKDGTWSNSKTKFKQITLKGSKLRWTENRDSSTNYTYRVVFPKNKTNQTCLVTRSKFFPAELEVEEDGSGMQDDMDEVEYKNEATKTNSGN